VASPRDERQLDQPGGLCRAEAARRRSTGRATFVVDEVLPPWHPRGMASRRQDETIVRDCQAPIWRI
jgi:hypothetical protein